MVSVLALQKRWGCSCGPAKAKVTGSKPVWRVRCRGHVVAATIPAMTTKDRLHKLVDELSDQEAEAALVIVERRRDDPMLHALASAPIDDEPSSAEEDAGAAEALDSYRRGEAISSEEIRQELGLD